MRSDSAGYILLVEDEPQIRDVYTLILESEGYRVVQAHDGMDALRVLNIQPGEPALILTDLMMPRMSGFELCRRLARMPAYADVPIVVLSTLASMHKLPSGGGVKVAYSKPLSVEDLLRCVETWGARARSGAMGRKMAPHPVERRQHDRRAMSRWSHPVERRHHERRAMPR